MPTAPNDWISETISQLPPVLTTADVIGVLRMSRRNLYRLIAAGRLRAVRQTERGSSPLLIPRASLESYLRSLDGGER